MDTRTAQLEVWAARVGGRRRGRRVRGRRGGNFMGAVEVCRGGVRSGETV